MESTWSLVKSMVSSAFFFFELSPCDKAAHIAVVSDCVEANCCVSTFGCRRWSNLLPASGIIFEIPGTCTISLL